MAHYPSIQTITETTFSSETTSHDVNMPASVDSGDLLVILFTANNGTVSTPAGWTEQYQELMDGDGAAVCYKKISDGTEGGTTVDLVTDSSSAAVAQVLRVVDNLGTLAGVESATADGSSEFPDPPSLSASWGTEHTLWVAVAHYIDDQATVDSYPSGYTGGTYLITNIGSNLGAGIAMAHNENETTTENPGAFHLNTTEKWRGVTIALRSTDDETAPTLSSPVGTETGATTADLSVDTDEGNGTAYAVVTQSATAPSATQVKNGQDHTGSAADYSTSEAVSSSGTINFTSASGLSAGTTYYAHFMHEDAATNQSSVSSSSSFTTSTTPTFPDDYQYKRSVAIASGQKTGTPSGVMLVVTHDSGINDTDGPLDADGSAPAQNGGGDLSASSDAAGTTRIALDVVDFTTANDPSTGTAELRVNFDDLSSDTFYLWWGTSGTTSLPGAGDTYGRNAVYPTAYECSLSLNEDPSDSAPEYTDRTGNSLDGTVNGTIAQAAAQIGDGADLDGNGDWIDVGSSASDFNFMHYGGGSPQWTWMAWVRLDHLASSARHILWSTASDSSSNVGVDFGKRNDDDALELQIFRGVGGTNVVATTQSNYFNTDSLMHAAFTYDHSLGSANLKLWRNGSSFGTDTDKSGDAPANNDANGPADLGRYEGGARYWNGLLDHVSVLSTPLGSDEISTIYNCESDNSAFWDIGSVVDTSAGGGAEMPFEDVYRLAGMAA